MRDALDYEFLYNKRGGFFETVITALYRGVVREGDAVLDGGAHIGTHIGPVGAMRRPIGEGRRGRSTPTPGREAAGKVPVGEIPQRGHQELRNQFFAGQHELLLGHQQ